MKTFSTTILFILVWIAPSVMAQKGTVKVFSEIKGVQIFMDEALQGTDVTVLDSVDAGTHYLKAVKDNTIIFSDLITVNPNAVTTVLIKSTKEMQEKLLESKYEDIQKFKNNKLEVMLSSQYVTSTSGVTNSIYYPGYYIITGTSFSNSYSTTEQQTDWFVARAGKVKISEYELARLAGDQDAMRRIEQVNDEVDERNAKIIKRESTGGIMLLAGTVSALVGLADVMLADFLSDGVAAGLFGGGIFVGVIGLVIVQNSNPKPYPSHYLTLEEAIKLADTYNRNLKKSLGLPDNYEP
ncbi:MAG: hypothetical protein ACPLXM_10625 [Bacteroidales bacterium]